MNRRQLLGAISGICFLPKRLFNKSKKTTQTRLAYSPNNPTLGKLVGINAYTSYDIQHLWSDKDHENSGNIPFTYVNFPVQLELTLTFEKGQEEYLTFIKNNTHLTAIINPDRIDIENYFLLVDDIRQSKSLGKQNTEHYDIIIGDHKFMLSSVMYHKGEGNDDD